VHLIGHSYGGKVILSALAAKPHARNVDSVLLLQPAMSYLCFAADVDGHPGGYRAALSRTEQPIMTTFSRNDIPLTRFFQWAARRTSDLGEVQIAGVPSRYAALGGFGPGGMDGEAVAVPARLPAEPYAAAPPGIRIVAVESSEFISGPGDISNDATHWMLLNQISLAG
jgi:pimeloyl-ACP methyl ester carboxylesterase